MNVPHAALLGFAFLLAAPGQAQPGTRILKTQRAKQYEAITRYPTFRERTPLADFAEARLAAWARRQHDDFVAVARRDLKAGASSLPQGVMYEQETASKVTFYRPSRFISVRFDQYQFTGGAHPNSFVTTFNFGRVGGVPRALTLGDLFTPGSDYKQRVSNLVLARLKRKGASAVVNGTVTRLEPVQLNRFVVLSDGLLWVFPPYDMGAYVEGQFEVKLTPAELGPNFRRALLAR